eukprot:IDg5939t1
MLVVDFVSQQEGLLDTTDQKQSVLRYHRAITRIRTLMQYKQCSRSTSTVDKESRNEYTNASFDECTGASAQ